jgi:hypothetical protein
MRKKYTGEKAKHRKDRQAERQKHIQALNENGVSEELPEFLLPDIFLGIQETYWDCLKSVPDPRSPEKRVYPLHLILHRIISGFIDGNKHIGVLFPTKRINVEAGKKKLGALPTRKTVYKLLRRIDWAKTNQILAPLWDRLGHTPALIVQREFRNPREILEEFREEQKVAETKRRKQLREEHEAKERSKGMSAAKAKGRGSTSPVDKVIIKKPELPELKSEPTPIVTQHDLVIDGKVVKASYNAGVKERVVHVTEIKRDENNDRSRFIIGACPTVLDRNGEWGAALSVLDALTPLSGDRVILVSGDAGFCVEEFCKWLNEKGFFLHLPYKRKRGEYFFEGFGLDF